MLFVIALLVSIPSTSSLDGISLPSYYPLFPIVRPLEEAAVASVFHVAGGSGAREKYAAKVRALFRNLANFTLFTVAFAFWWFLTLLDTAPRVDRFFRRSGGGGRKVGRG